MVDKIAFSSAVGITWNWDFLIASDSWGAMLRCSLNGIRSTRSCGIMTEFAEFFLEGRNKNHCLSDWHNGNTEINHQHKKKTECIHKGFWMLQIIIITIHTKNPVHTAQWTSNKKWSYSIEFECLLEFCFQIIQIVNEAVCNLLWQEATYKICPCAYRKFDFSSICQRAHTHTHSRNEKNTRHNRATLASYSGSCFVWSTISPVQ